MTALNTLLALQIALVGSLYVFTVLSVVRSVFNQD